MEDVADVCIRKARENLSKWENIDDPIAPIDIEEKDTVLELSAVSAKRAYSNDIITETESTIVASSSKDDVEDISPLHSSSQVS